ncbi:MAG: hypothetical protein KDI82_08510 [Gammaproteobacteria bacterium]|nr:hypothetical protein [Gammaproteobacteria bacterium]
MKRILFATLVLVASTVAAGSSESPLAQDAAHSPETQPVAPPQPPTDSSNWAKLDRHGHDRYLRFAVGASYLESPFSAEAGAQTER